MQLKPLLTSILILSLWSCHAQKSEHVAAGEEALLLSGDWKFHTIYGEGSNYITVSETPEDIIIDNSSKEHVKVKGDWILKTEGDRGSTFYGKNYLQRSFGKDESENNYVRYTPALHQSEFYEAFVRFPFASHLTAQVNVNHGGGLTSSYFNQRNRCDQWLSLGVFTFDKTDTNYIEVTAITPNTVVADAVMFRPVSSEKMETSKEEKATIFKSDFDDSNWKNLSVPGHWGMLNEYSNYTGIGWYRKTFNLPPNWKKSSEERIRVKFDAVYHLAKIFLNGELIGSHQGGFTPFEFDVTDELNFNGPNVIAVEADNSALVGATWNWGGIIRDVHLVKNNNVRISYQYIHAEPDLKKGSANLKLKVRVKNSSAKKRTVMLASQIDEAPQTTDLQYTITIPANSTKEIQLASTLPASAVKLWHFDTPNLYHLTTTVTENGQTLAMKKDRFGIRKVELTDSQLILNGEPVRLGGFNRVSDHRYWGSSEPQYLINKDVDLMKNAGANFMRIMHGTQNKKLIERCDEKGILLFEEVNVRELTNPEFTAPDYPLAKQWLKEMIDRDVNHPSIIGWSVGNELKDHYDYAKLTIDYVKNELDPYRLVTCVSNSGWRDTATPENDPNSLVDMIMHNLYPFQGKPEEVFKTLRSKWPDKPIFISEYGIKPMATTSLDGDIPEISEWNSSLQNKNPFVIGASLWTFNDYRSGYAATSPEENRVWGLVNAWRQKRKLYNRIENEHSPVEQLEVLDLDIKKGYAQITITTKNSENYPSYTLRNHSLVWSLHNTKGDTLAKNTVKLPTLQPGDTESKISMNWKPYLTDVTSVHVSVLSPNGYTRKKKRIALSVPGSPSISTIENGDASVRIHFNPVFNVDTYHVTHQNNKGEIVKSKETTTNFIELNNLENGKEYSFKVIATNEKGESKPSEMRIAKPNGKVLPPVIWDAFVVGDKLIVGYSGASNDVEYTVKYGLRETYFQYKSTTITRGMTVIAYEGDAPHFISIMKKTKNGQSDWSKPTHVYSLINFDK
ncbi:glycoside hydrolase family 2 TIM barrel-domain containing protein [Zobellia uliginosa]|uniref:glycoside hydrolase family 2 TIM barrel-domain containing protein n=1 Tax=Zobellia uliginosa TaxID=143224 RepID=UPI001C076DDF|nr:glycoside hydrolase family 2 TIM barrel-domain containing protein [Zobellia uliginosa]MBU2945490.1 beta galactosidase jelly roll domain-containing protein [Zobellia uliginosa]